MADNEDVFEMLGKRGPPLKHTIQQMLFRLAEDEYPPFAVAAALAQVAVNMAAKLPDAENIGEFARTFDGYARQLRELAQAKGERDKN